MTTIPNAPLKLISALALVAASACTDAVRRPTGTVCYPPAWGGIVPGYTEDADIVSVFGAGLFTEELGHGGGRYYTDPNRTATLVVEIGVDSIIESIHVSNGL